MLKKWDNLKYLICDLKFENTPLFFIFENYNFLYMKRRVYPNII